MSRKKYTIREIVLSPPPGKNLDTFISHELDIYEMMVVGRLYTNRDISKRLGLEITTISKCCRRLQYKGLIKVYEVQDYINGAKALKHHVYERVIRSKVAP